MTETTEMTEIKISPRMRIQAEASVITSSRDLRKNDSAAGVPVLDGLGKKTSNRVNKNNYKNNNKNDKKAQNRGRSCKGQGEQASVHNACKAKG